MKRSEESPRSAQRRRRAKVRSYAPASATSAGAYNGAAEESSCHFFFFQAEDGIRDHCVTGVQTCALPIFHGHREGKARATRRERANRLGARSEERRVGKSVDLGGRRIIKKKKKD